MEKSNSQLVEILLVEDNPGDIRLTKEALKEYKVLNNLNVATDGEMALKFLYREGEFKDAPTPDIILLDLNLPKVDGREVLEEIKKSEELRSIPIVVLSTSDAEEDIYKSYQNYANCYITKPIDFDQFMTVIKEMQNFWVSIVKLPKVK